MGDFSRGVSYSNTLNYKDRDQTEIENTRFPIIYQQSVDFSKLRLNLIKSWVYDNIYEAAGEEDDIIANYFWDMLQKPDTTPKQLEMCLRSFLGDECGRGLMVYLWKCFLEAQSTPLGIPPQLIEAKKEELAKKKIETEKLQRNLNDLDEAAKAQDRPEKKFHYMESLDAQERSQFAMGGDEDLKMHVREILMQRFGAETL